MGRTHSGTGLRISVLLPIHNEEELLPAALDSLWRQTEVDFEVVAVDDGSTDGTWGMLERIAEQELRLRPFHQDHAGIVAALNRGLGEVRGPLIARMDADDVSHPNRLRLQADCLDRNPDTGLVASRVTYLGDAEANRGLTVFVDWTNSLLLPDDISLYRFVETPLIHPSVMFRRELPDRHGGYRDGPFPEDYELWLRWLEGGVRMVKLEEPLLEWRERPWRLTRIDPRYGVDAFYRTKSPYLYRWLERHNPHHPDVIVWGAGRTSRQRLRFLTDLGVRVKAYIDVDPRKLGYRIDGAEVLPPSALPAPEDCFVLGWVSSRGARAEIEAELQQRGYCRGRHYLPCA